MPADKKKLPGRIFSYTRHSPLRITLIYMGVATLWILTSSYLVPQTISNPQLQSFYEIAKGLLFVVVTGTLLYFMLRSWVPQDPQKKEVEYFEIKSWKKIRIVPATLSLLLFLPLLIFLIHQLNAPALEREGLARLQGKAKIEAIHIESWLKELDSDAKVLYHNRTLSEMINTLQRTDSNKSHSIVTEYLQEIQKNYNYEAIILLGKDGNRLLSFGDHTDIPPATMELVREARKRGVIQHNHQFTLKENHLHTDYVVPLYQSQKNIHLIAFAIMRSKLNDALKRVSIARKDTAFEDDVLLLHVDHKRLIAFNTRTGKPHHTRERSQLEKYLPAANALRDKPSGSIITTDYRGKTVLAAWQFISGTDWFILTKVDRDKVLSPLWRTLGWVLLVGIFLTAAVIALLNMLWNRQEYYAHLEKLAHETQTDKLMRQFFDMPFVGMAIWSAKNGEWLRFNDYFCDLLGYSKERLEQMRWDNLLHHDDLATDKQLRQEIIDGKTESYAVEKRLLRIDGSVINANIDVHCVRDEHNLPALFIATIQDVTAYRHTIEALRESEERFRTIFDGALDGIVMAEKESGAFITGNTAFCNMLGYTAEEIAHMSFHDIHPEEALARAESDFLEIAQGKLTFSENFPTVRKDGSVFYTDIKGGRIKVDDREYIIGIFRDTSERNAMLQALSDNEKRLKTLINTIPDLVWLKDVNGTYLLCNTHFEDFFGAKENDIKGKSDYDFVDKKLADFFLEQDRKTMLADKPSINEERVTFATDGHEEILETIKSPVHDSQGNLIGILGIGRDITLRKEYENRLRRLSQFYAALSQCNESIIRSSDETELLQDICRIAVQLTQIKATWVGFIDQETQQIYRTAGYGEGNEEIATTVITLCNASEIELNPSYRAIKQSHAIWVQSLSPDDLCKACYEIVASHDWHSAAYLPLYREGTVIGVLNLYADIENAFDDEVIKLLNEMAFDISFALDNFVLEEQRIDSERSLIESEQRFRGLVEQSLAGIYIIQDGRYVYANPRLAEILGFQSYKQLQDHTPTDFIVSDDHQMVSKQIDDVLKGKKKHLTYEAKVRRTDGVIIDVGVHGALANHQGKPAVIGLVQDVTDKKLAEAQLNTYVEKLQSSLMQTVEVATILSEMRDPYTAGHERRVAEIAVAIGREMGLDEYALEGLRVAGYLHDIGKINIPSEILAKPGKLTELEYEIIKGHPQSGYNVLKDVDFPWPVAQVALQHHERINGSGYPDGLKGDNILLEARITAVADVVEAMGSHRPYRPGLGIKPALEEIERGKGTLYDVQVAEACLRLFREKNYSLPA